MRRSLAPLLVALLTAGCTKSSKATESGIGGRDSGDDTGVLIPGTVELVVPAGWTELPLADDPLADHRPETVDCDPDGWHPEEGVLEIETNLCNYASLVQSSRADIAEGDTLDLLVYHSALAAPEPAEAHVAVLLDGAVLWEALVPIPSATEIYSTQITASGDVPQGAPIILHLHNHGGNAWKLGHLRRTRD